MRRGEAVLPEIMLGKRRLTYLASGIKAGFNYGYPTGLPPTTNAHEQKTKLLALAPKPATRPCPAPDPQSRTSPLRSLNSLPPFISRRHKRLATCNSSTSEQEESVRLSVTALGALQHSIDLTGKQNDRYLATFAPLDEHHRFAVEQYSKAIKVMRHAIWLQKHSLRTTLLNCLLAICFETMHGNDQSAIAQMDVGIRLLEDYISSNRKSFSKKDLAATNSNLRNTAKDPISPLFALESPAPHEVEDE
ncbi:uncharacterized protein PAC_11790 [Phialocephala subalpina]|uniref:Uncharacterized protein n=1 Tax=Phialocephala subalpina TaxID=576137 RepID=A0A1L7XA33_9HELO|nr:uncharacterized protein PAC_11790 [Phialocephala subalpina]